MKEERLLVPPVGSQVERGLFFLRAFGFEKERSCERQEDGVPLEGGALLLVGRRLVLLQQRSFVRSTERGWKRMACSRREGLLLL